MAFFDGSLNPVLASSVRAASWIVVIPALSNASKPRPCPIIRRLISEFVVDDVSAMPRRRRLERPLLGLAVVSFWVIYILIYGEKA